MKKMCESLEKQMYVTKLLLSLGVPAHLKGYHYLRSAILRSEQDIEVVSSVTKLLYRVFCAFRKRQTDKQRIYCQSRRRSSSGIPGGVPDTGKMNKQEIYPEATWRGYLLFLQDMK